MQILFGYNIYNKNNTNKNHIIST